MINNKKGYSTGFTWIFGLVSIFGIGVLYIVFNQVLEGHLVPTITEQVTGGAFDIPVGTQNTILGNIDKYMSFFHALPYILFFVIVIYMIVAAIRKEQESAYL